MQALAIRTVLLVVAACSALTVELSPGPLREIGPQGIDRFVAAHREELDRLHPPAAVRAALDRICAQRDCHASGLYWHTDLERARDAAEASGKPILSLRLLGRLDEEYSCANSRFFRTALYADRAVAEMLRRDFVLHWQSVRPAPIVTVDMGDGRSIRRTVTGNSIHYVLDGRGRVLDAVPGLYGPRAFAEILGRARQLFDAMEQDPVYVDEGPLQRHHLDRLQQIVRVWRSHLGEAPSFAELAVPAGHDVAFVDARSAGLVTATKLAVELPLLQTILEELPLLEDRTDDPTWERIARAYGSKSVLGPGARRLIAEQLARPDGIAPDPAELDRIVQRFEQRMALDSVRNELLLHRKIHEWFVAGEVGTDLEALNERVYTELFLTPGADEWLGLVPPDTYTALDGGGLDR